MIRPVLLAVLAALSAATADRAAAIVRIRQQLADDRAHIHYSVADQFTPANTTKWLALLEQDGRFSDLHLDGLDPRKYDGAAQKQLAGKLLEAWTRIRILAQLAIVDGSHKGDDSLKRRLMKAAVHYGEIELQRCDGWFRFHASCFGIPRVAYGVYFAFFEDFAAAEKARDRKSLAGHCSQVLQAVMRQTFTQPKRDDVKNPYSVEQFRNNPAWVGGNFAYRPAFEAAAVCSDPRMLDIVAAVCAGALGPVSHNTLSSAFWTEGLCADGAGWGHGPQCYVWGYPTDGLSAALALLKRFRGTPWEADVPPAAFQYASAYIEGMCWYQYRGRQTLLSPGRSGFAAGPGEDSKRIASLATSLLSFPLAERTSQRMKQLRAQIEGGKVDAYGTRVFWNNDDIVRRHPSYYIGVNMVSSRTQSNEVVGDGFSQYTDFFADGATFIHRDGLEYGAAKGAWDPSAVPGTTTRETELKPVELWAGYRGVHSLAGGVADGTDGCAGFVYEKQSRKESPTPGLYGVRACKSYFFAGDAMICLGAGITNRTPDVPGDVRTTIDQPEWRGPVALTTARAGARTIAPGKPRKYQLKPDQTGDIRVEHNGIAYTVLAGQTDGRVEFVAQTARTHWVLRHGGNRGRKDMPREVPLFRLAVNHGKSPDGATYGYVVQPLGKGAIPARVVANSRRLQAVASPDGSLIQAVFFSADKTLAAGDLRLRVSSPAALMLRRQGGKATLAVADLAQDPECREVVVRTNLPGADRLRVPLPGKPNCGKAAEVTFSLP